MSEIHACPEDGYFEGEECPVCGNDGELVVPDGRRTQLSKFLSGALRHFPDDVGLELDQRGWTDVDGLVRTTAEKYDWFEAPMIEAVVATDPKGRFERDGDRIRASYGHSVDVSLATTETPVPDELFHGTAPENVDAILQEGLRPMERQLVHLSDSVAAAMMVGRRHAAEPVILRVDAAALLDDGWNVTKRGESVFTVDRVPPTYLTVRE